ncbi:MAG: DNA mismatch repair endonuclease MutL [Dehalococcoidia bacterium]|nr:DNA mismatch repair endonuclease MutL [Dehalococcoidia bacterium]
MTIRVLSPEVAARIAAGEVVERPASVVKELVENALDAGARAVSVEVTAGGLESIRVSDDGCGLAAEELEVAFARHATSKLADEELLRIETLGFRGEALPAIAAVSEVEMASRPPGAQAAAYVRLEGGVVLERGERGAPAGTTVTVRELFVRQPARRKFLRSPLSEANQIASVVSHYALARPAVRFSLTLDGRSALLTDGNGDLRDAIAAVYGTDVASAMLPVAPGEGPIAVDGLVATPHVSRAGRGYVSLFVNGRWVQSRRLAYAVEEAYRGLLMVGRYPIVVLHLRLPFEDVDVNVHPAKAEVRFRDESAAFGAVQRAVRTALLESAPVPVAASVGGLELAVQPSMPPLWEHARSLERRESGIAAEETAVAATPAAALPALRVIGQFGSTYVIAEGPDGMYMIDQHAAHERVLYERFCRQRLEQRPDAQALLEPVTLELSPPQRTLLAEHEELLREHGFQVEPFGEGSYLVRALPAPLAASDPRQAVASFLDLMLEEGEGDRRDRVAMSLACHGAIRAGQTLSSEEMRELVSLLEASEAPHTCPHGRPTMIHMSAETLARQFGRR